MILNSSMSFCLSDSTLKITQTNSAIRTTIETNDFLPISGDKWAKKKIIRCQTKGWHKFLQMFETMGDFVCHIDEIFRNFMGGIWERQAIST